MKPLKKVDLEVGVTYLDIISEQKVLIVAKTPTGEVKGKSLNTVTGEYPIRAVFDGQLKQIKIEEQL